MELDLLDRKLESIGQTHLLRFWSTLDEPEQNLLADQVKRLDIDLVVQLRQLKDRPKRKKRDVKPYDGPLPVPGGEPRRAKVGVVILAGGQGTRVNFEGPKGAYPVWQGKSLFELLLRKIALSDPRVPVAIMTSHLNDEATRAHFEEHAYFGMDPRGLRFMVQASLPLLNEQGNLFLDRPWRIAEGPDGNGGVFALLDQVGQLDVWSDQGVEVIHVLPIDNPLADPLDRDMSALLFSEKADLVLKCIERTTPDEQVGLVVLEGRRVAVCEYSEAPPEILDERSGDALAFRLANIGRFCVGLESAKELAGVELPFHVAKKAVEYLDGGGNVARMEEAHAWKFEYFIFDLFPHLSKVLPFLDERSRCFAPLKDFASLVSVQEALSACPD